MTHYEYDSDILRTEDRTAQLEVMEEWFRSVFEDPAERTPYESREGGYIWIWGGPHNAADELSEEFSGIVPDDVIDELAEKLSEECLEWAPTERPGDYDEGLFEAISSNVLARQSLDIAVATIRSLMVVVVPAEVLAAYNRLLFANAITALETYLSDTFINRVLESRELLQTYIDFDPKFRDRKVAYKDVIREAGRVEQEAKAELLDLVWHNLGKVKPMYAQVLTVDVGDVGTLAEAVQIRHDIVHRNGRKKDGKAIEVTHVQISQLLEEITELAARVELKLDFNIDAMPLEGDHGNF